MRAYLAATGTLFALVVVLHAWRTWLEGPGIWAQPTFVVFTVVPAALAAWAWRLYRSGRKAQTAEGERRWPRR